MKAIEPQEKFTTSIIATYKITNNKKAIIDQRIILKNNSNQYYPKEYSLILPTDQVESISARDRKGNILADYRKEKDRTQIHIRFNEKIIGKDSETKFRISFESDKIIQSINNQLSITIPSLTDPESVASYTAILKVPSDFPALISTNPKASFINKNEIFWLNDNIKNASISAVFGNEITAASTPAIIINKEQKTSSIPLAIFAGFLIISIAFIIYKKITK